MTQKDIADLRHDEFDSEAATITRKRSKTKEHENVPVVRYKLWPETLALLNQQKTRANAHRLILNQDGKPLWLEELTASGKFRKNDNIRNAIDRLRKELGIAKPAKSLKKTSATLLRGNSRHATLETVFLGHAPSSISHRHYALPPQQLLDEAIMWLRDALQIAECLA